MISNELLSQVRRLDQADKFRLMQFLITELANEAGLELETDEQIAADEALWDAQFAATPESRLDALVTSVEAEIQAGKSRPMFNDRGVFNEP
ncbi:MAG: hypothetical protein NZM11_01285 [Anaerolineales bacterium]|nr:hypothetical protein [Anaerolineales bacterium]